MDFGQWLDEHDVSQAEAANRLRCSTSTVWKIVQREGVPSIVVAMKIRAMTNREVDFEDMVSADDLAAAEEIRETCSDLRTRFRPMARVVG